MSKVRPRSPVSGREQWAGWLKRGQNKAEKNPERGQLRALEEDNALAKGLLSREPGYRPKLQAP